MAAKKSFARMVECDGFSCGSNIKKGSLPVDRIIESELKEFVKEYLESAGPDSDMEWLINLVKELIKSQKDEEWWHDVVCNVDCGSGGGDFTVVPDVLRFKAQGGKLTVDIVTDATTAWSVVN